MPCSGEAEQPYIQTGRDRREVIHTSRISELRLSRIIQPPMGFHQRNQEVLERDREGRSRKLSIESSRSNQHLCILFNNRF
mmetsp:Transcript_24146/g.34792  ORF Transcript_24146/g.34792 Transcript_24146/m.34792 type:complete len:81 (-) Transcript_24146:663-905(-)